MPLCTHHNAKLSIPLITFLSLAGLCILVRVRSFSSYTRTIKPVSLSTSSTSMSSSSSSSSSSSTTRASTAHWKPLGPETFPTVVSSEDGCRYAKDEEYLTAVLDLWKQDIATDSRQQVETSPWIYHDDDDTPLHGHIIRPIRVRGDAADTDQTPGNASGSNDNPRSLPGILLFHTAAGPQDVFLFQKATKLAASPELGGCVVFVCDVLSDPDGWAWTPDGDRTRFNRVKDDLLRDNARVLRSRVSAAIRAIGGGEFGVDPTRLAALGWCFGAQPILEVATLQHEQDQKKLAGGDGVGFSAVALVSYHGVYRRDPSQTPDFPSPTGTIARDSNDPTGRAVLICTGKSDPFVAPEDLEFAKAAMEEKSYSVEIVEFDGAKHGFTNPAQDYNTNPAFQYNENAATKSWESTMDVLKQGLLQQ